MITIVSILVALAFLAAGGVKLAQPREKVIESGQDWAEDFSDQQLKGIGAVELTGAILVFLGGVLGVANILAILGASLLIATMGGAAYTHYRRQELPKIAPNVVLALLALIVLLGSL